MNKSIFREKKLSGISAVPLIIALVLMITVGGFFISLMLGKHIGAPLLAQSTKALYIAEAGIEFTHEYLKSIGNWTTVTNISSTSFGGGTFAVAFAHPPINPQNSVTAASTGTIGNAVRVISINFERKSLLSLSPGNWVNEIDINDNVTVEMDDDGNGTVESFSCPECDAEAEENESCSCTGCTNCINRVELGEAPTLNPPSLPNATWSCPPTPETSYTGTVTISVNCTFPQGTYFFDELEIDTSAIVTVASGESVTIWILDKFEMKEGATFNWGGAAANLLLLSAGEPEDAEPDFEIEDGARFSGAIYGPQAEVEIRDAQIDGAIIGNEVELRDTTITHDPTAGRNTTGYSLVSVVTGSDWGEK